MIFLTINALTPEICECCRRKAPTLLQQHEMLVCEDCEKNLTARSLSPREWYNLVTIHGIEKELINIKYYYADGESIAAKIKREFTEANQLPTLISIGNNFNQLMEFYFFALISANDPEEFPLLLQFPGDEVLAYLDACMKTKPTIHVWNSCYKIVAKGLKDGAVDWIKRQWQTNAVFAYEIDALDSLMAASVACLSTEEILELAKPLLAMQPGAIKNLFPYPAFKEVALVW